MPVPLLARRQLALPSPAPFGPKTPPRSARHARTRLQLTVPGGPPPVSRRLKDPASPRTVKLPRWLIPAPLPPRPGRPCNGCRRGKIRLQPRETSRPGRRGGELAPPPSQDRSLARPAALLRIKKKSIDLSGPRQVQDPSPTCFQARRSRTAKTKQRRRTPPGSPVPRTRGAPTRPLKTKTPTKPPRRSLRAPGRRSRPSLARPPPGPSRPGGWPRPPSPPRQPTRLSCRRRAPPRRRACAGHPRPAQT